MSHDHHSSPIPRPVFIGAAVMIAIAVTAALFGQPEREAAERIAGLEVVQTRALHFQDRADGTVVVLEAPDNTLVDELMPGEHAFIRTVLRTLARARVNNGFDDQEPFHLTRWSNGHLTITDPTTGKRINLGSFGETNVGAFETLMVEG